MVLWIGFPVQYCTLSRVVPWTDSVSLSLDKYWVVLVLNANTVHRQGHRSHEQIVSFPMTKGDAQPEGIFVVCRHPLARSCMVMLDMWHTNAFYALYSTCLSMPTHSDPRWSWSKFKWCSTLCVSATCACHQAAGVHQGLWGADGSASLGVDILWTLGADFCWSLDISWYFFDLQYFCHHQPQSLSGLFPFITSLSVAYSPQNLQIDAVVAPNHTVSMKRGTWTQ